MVADVFDEAAEVAGTAVTGESAEAYYDLFARNPERHVGLEGVVPASGVGFAPEEALRAPEGSDRGLSSGNPFEGLAIPEGASVLDIGCGAGRDCFLAAMRVGASGQVVGVDASAEMVRAARDIAVREGFANVAFREGNVLSLPVADGSMDFALSNCVFNNVEDKAAAFAEVRRVLRPGGTFSFSDVMTTPEASPRLAKSKTACLARAVRVDAYIEALERAGFSRIEVASERPWPTYRGVVSAQIIARV